MSRWPRRCWAIFYAQQPEPHERFSVSKYDLVIRNGTLVTEQSVAPMDIAIHEERITDLKAGLDCSARDVVDATGLHVFPALIDSHVHFNDPGRTDWEGFFTGSRALAAGGGTLCFDMPLNAHPPTVDAESFDKKLAVATGRSMVDFGLWGGLVRDNLDQLEALASRGVIGFKAFMADSGIEDFSFVDDRTLKAGMKRIAGLGRVIAVHAESQDLIHERTSRLIAEGRLSAQDFLNSRPVDAELDAIRRAVEMAGETRCALHVVHVSCGAGVAMIAAARAGGVDVSCETCPHYLTLTDADLLRLGARAKCAPPLRPAAEQDALWERLRQGEITTIGSDHSPSPPELKDGENFFKVWGGIPGIQHTLSLLLDGGRARKVPLPLLAKMTSANVANRFGLSPAKGKVQIGSDADLVLVDLNQRFEVKLEDLFDRHRLSPYTGRALTGRVIQTILRGRTIYKNDRIVAQPAGQLVTPNVPN